MNVTIKLFCLVLFFGITACSTPDEVVGNDTSIADGVSTLDGESSGDAADFDIVEVDTFVPECTETKPCNDGNPCTIDECLIKDGVCKHTNNFDKCDDGNLCTTDSCNPNKGCVYISNSESCDDDNPYTESDLCKSGECHGTPSVKCIGNIDCSIENACVKQVQCFDGLCDAKMIDCDDNNQCTDDWCDPKNGCKHKDNVKQCDDGNKCKEPGECSKGNCLVTNQKKVCDDNDVCTTDTCDPKAGCTFVKKKNSCDDGEICTIDYCDPKKGCVHTENKKNELCLKNCTSLLDCEDDNPCTKDSCNEQIGKCIYDSLDGDSCSDDSSCTKSDVCYKGVCKGDEVICDDQNPCTQNSCNKVTGCFFQDLDKIPCDDGDVCTKTDQCQKGKCLGITNQCDDNNSCTSDSCNDQTGECVNTPLDTKPCDDGNACTEGDQCTKDKCVSGKYPNCSDGNVCTLDVCDKAIGCFSKPHTSTVKCDDGDKCTQTDLCKGSKCVPGQKTNCNDNDVCTIDSCDTQTGSCINKAVTNGDQFCTDNNECTTNDKCVIGKCVGKQVECTDGNPCTDSTCDKKKGCITKVLDKSSCNDGNPCTTNDLCKGKDCIGVPKKCNDFNACTLDICDSATGGCTTKYNDSQPCNDGSSCTKVDKCNQGLCKGEAIKCEDGNTCTEDTCDPTTGCKYPALDKVKCDDGNLCTKFDLCNNDKCIGSKIICNDNNTCTKDSCDLKTGKCTYVKLNDGYWCDDGDKCTQPDICALGKCNGKPRNCDDGNPCTNDSCDPNSGCKHIKKGPNC